MKKMITILSLMTIASTVLASNSALVQGSDDSVCRMTAVNAVNDLEARTGGKLSGKSVEAQVVKGNTHVFVIVANRKYQVGSESKVYTITVDFRSFGENNEPLCEVVSVTGQILK